jgi:hypothetical protein
MLVTENRIPRRYFLIFSLALFLVVSGKNLVT